MLVLFVFPFRFFGVIDFCEVDGVEAEISEKCGICRGVAK